MMDVTAQTKQHDHIRRIFYVTSEATLQECNATMSWLWNSFRMWLTCEPINSAQAINWALTESKGSRLSFSTDDRE